MGQNCAGHLCPPGSRRFVFPKPSWFQESGLLRHMPGLGEVQSSAAKGKKKGNQAAARQHHADREISILGAVRVLVTAASSAQQPRRCLRTRFFFLPQMTPRQRWAKTFPFSEKELNSTPHFVQWCSLPGELRTAPTPAPRAPLTAAVSRRCSTVCSWEPAACSIRVVPAEFDVSAHRQDEIAPSPPDVTRTNEMSNVMLLFF